MHTSEIGMCKEYMYHTHTPKNLTFVLMLVDQVLQTLWGLCNNPPRSHILTASFLKKYSVTINISQNIRKKTSNTLN